MTKKRKPSKGCGSHLKDYRIILIKVLGGKCVKCGTTENLVIHHKKYSNNPKLKDIEVQCDSCHKRGTKKWKGGKK